MRGRKVYGGTNDEKAERDGSTLGTPTETDRKGNRRHHSWEQLSHPARTSRHISVILVTPAQHLIVTHAHVLHVVSFYGQVKQGRNHPLIGRLLTLLTPLDSVA